MHLSVAHKSSMDEAARISVEVVYALPGRQTVITLTIPPNASVSDAIRASGIAIKHPEIDADAGAVGIFGKQVSLDTQPLAGDRIEIYRPLEADPKQSRRARVRMQRRK
jgi:putative ubiquitin-RnfH superfamily antitoxin RatB of RatAB toxin-antitoxin module